MSRRIRCPNCHTPKYGLDVCWWCGETAQRLSDDLDFEEFLRPAGSRAQAADRIEELEAKLAKAEWLLVDAAVQLEEGKIKTRRNRAVLIRQFLAELTGGKDVQSDDV